MVEVNNGGKASRPYPPKGWAQGSFKDSGGRPPPKLERGVGRGKGMGSDPKVTISARCHGTATAVPQGRLLGAQSSSSRGHRALAEAAAEFRYLLYHFVTHTDFTLHTLLPHQCSI